MTNPNGGSSRERLQRIARRAMLERSLDPDFSSRALHEAGGFAGPAKPQASGVRDLRNLPWCSIDNDDSMDLDQLTVGEALKDGGAKALVAVADVDALVRKQSALDGHAHQNTTSVYTAGGTFPMLPNRLSTDLTSLAENGDREAVVIEMVFAPDGALRSSDVYEATVRNRAKLAYPSLSVWLEGSGPMPPKIASVDGLEDNLRLQDRIAQRLKARRHASGSLEFETIKARPIFDGDILTDLEDDRRNRARDLIEDFMVAANSVTARFLAARNFASLRRVVKVPKRWDRIVELAGARGTALPGKPDGPALQRFLEAAKAADPEGFADLSLCVIKLMGRGEYVIESPGSEPQGHFGLAAREYAHSTAPNRRYPDLIAQRLLKAAIAGSRTPYKFDELKMLASHCTSQEDNAKKVERQVAKSAAAILLESRIGVRYDAIVTGATDRGRWVRILRPPVEGKVVEGFAELEVGDRVEVELIHVDAERGHIDFRTVRRS